ncbi:MAG TPA: urate hydroxylase PuuD [Stellaceae bacterium]|nr:urate hydroxylase PuuD [Stellaceae bacterium]
MEWGELVTHAWWTFAFRWFHVIAGIMWIGHLWYFNFTQTPTMPKIPQELRPGVARYILPEALWWFRWGAMLTIITGLILAWLESKLIGVISIGLNTTPHIASNASLGIGMWLGAIMWANVWFIIWPNQKKNMGLVQVTPEQRTRAARIAGLASRVNTMLSIPMLYGMTSVHFY